MIYFISDTHYSHTNIVKSCSKWTDKSGCRDFLTMYDHNLWLVDQINNRVQAKDTLWHLGDWSFGGKSQIKEFRDRINCQNVHLIYGNHDHHQQAAFGDNDVLFSSRQHYRELQFDGLQLVLMHYPLESWNNMERGSLHLHGHTHGQLRAICGRLDVGVDALGLTSLDQLKEFPVATESRHKTIEGGNKFA